MEITSSLQITEKEIDQLEMHSVINVFTVVNSQLQLIQMNADEPQILDAPLEAVGDFANAARTQNKEKFTAESLKQFENILFESLDKLAGKQPVLSDGTKTEEYKKIFSEILKIAAIRVSELHRRWNNPDSWESHNIKEFEKDFRNFFHALEKNSKGKYRIIYNIAEQEEKDYLIQFNISGDNSTIDMPILLKDVIRDLIANARKYTPPGGTITIGISQKKERIRFVVEDNGFGIPEDEISEIVKFGYRGSNIKEMVRTMGGGFGLTKAWYVTDKFNGRMWIESKIDRGTKVIIDLPIPDAT